MVGSVIVSHGRFGEEIICSLEMITETHVDGIVAVSISMDDTSADLNKMLKSAIKSVDSGCGVILLSDMFGGTASNLTLSFLNLENIEVVSGVNLPMVMKVIQDRDSKNIRELAKEVAEFGKENIILASSV